jgi:asparagine synthetase A
MESLQAEKRKRERDLDLLRISEPKLKKELDGLQESMKRMERDMEVRFRSIYVIICDEYECINRCICI